jgi:hypothetical protein
MRTVPSTEGKKPMGIWLVSSESCIPERLSLDDPRLADWIRRNSS